MTIASTSSPSKGKVSSYSVQKEKESCRTKCPGVRVVGCRIYDSENGKSCHQCRQKTMDYMATCKNLKNQKQCTIKFCHKCLLNRYGEKAEDVALLDGWNCPRCRGICNCSLCMKKRGHKPTGQMVHTAKATGFSSVSEMLQIRGHDNLSHNEKIAEDMVVPPKKSLASEKESGAAFLKKTGKENSFDGDCESNLNSQSLIPIFNKEKSKKIKRKGLKEICNSNTDDDVSLRRKSPKKQMMSGEIAKKENSIICKETSKKEKVKVSEEISKIKKPRKKVKTNENGSANHENIRVLDGVKNNNTGFNLKPVSDSFKFKKYMTELQNKEFAADLLLPRGARLTNVAGIEISPEDVGQALQFLEFCAAFGEALTKSISGSKCALNDIPSDCFDRDCDGYNQLDGSKKLKLLNFLCDEALGTIELRSWIDDQNAKFVERVKESREKVVAAKDKEKQLKQKLQDEVAKVIIAKEGAPFSVSEHEANVTEIKSKAAEANSELVEAVDMVPKKRQRYDAVRTEPVSLEDNGCALWRLKCYRGEPDILLQDMEGTWDAVSLNEKWFVYDADQVPGLDKYISSLRAKRLRVHKNKDSHAICKAKIN